MKKLTRAQKDIQTNLGKKRHKKDLKRRPRVKLIIASMRKLNRIQKKLEKIKYLQAKYGNKVKVKTGQLL